MERPIIKLASGHTAQELDEEEATQYGKDFTGSAGKIIKLQPGNWIMYKENLKYDQRLFDFKFRSDDVLVMTYPKCGTTWTQEIIWTMLNNPNLDNPKATEGLLIRSPFMDMDMLFVESLWSPEMLAKELYFKGFSKYCPDGDPNQGIMIQMAEATPSPRTLKTHLTFSMMAKSLPDTCKVVYVARNPKDAVLSYLHHQRLLRVYGFTGDQDMFIDYFVRDMLLRGSYAEHLKEGWRMRDHPNVHFVFYEDLKADIVGELKRLDGFLGTKLTDEQLENVRQKTTFKNMKSRDTVQIMKSGLVDGDFAEKEGGFMRKGEAGSWKTQLTSEQEAKIDAWTKKNLEGSGITFKYE